MRRMIDVSQGSFSLSVAVCNSPALRDHLVSQILQSRPGLALVNVPPTTIDVLRCIPDSCIGVTKGIFVVGLEHSTPSGQPEYPVLRILNTSREQWEKLFPCPVVFWLPEYAASLMSQHAADFWRYRSHRFEFVAEHIDLAATRDLMQSLRRDSKAWESLSKNEKLFRVAELQQRIADAGSPPDPALIKLVVVWSLELVQICVSLDDAALVQETNEKLIRLLESDVAHGIDEVQCLGLMAAYGIRGDFHRAEEMAKRVIDVFEKPDRLLADLCGTLASTAYWAGDTAQAEKISRRAIALYEKLPRLADCLVGYLQVGQIYQRHGDFEKAEVMYRKALAVGEAKRLDDARADSLQALGSLFQKRGIVDQAIEYYQNSLEINERLGRLARIAEILAAQGDLDFAQGNVDQAEQTYRKALEINEKLGTASQISSNLRNLAMITASHDGGKGFEELRQRAFATTEPSIDTAFDLCLLGMFYRAEGNLDRAGDVYQRELEVSLRIGNPKFIGDSYRGLGWVAMQRGRNSDAHDLLRQAIEQFKQGEYASEIEITEALSKTLPSKSDTPVRDLNSSLPAP